MHTEDQVHEIAAQGGAPERIPALDGVRGIAALMVMWFHFFQFYSPGGTGVAGMWIKRLSSAGQTGVDLFFVLSGFLITRILLAAKDQPRYFINFYTRRALRILPLYYLFLVIFVFIQPTLVGERTPSWTQHWWSWVYLQNIPMSFGWPAYYPAHFWSLAVEEHFYLIWPLIVFHLGRRSLAIVCVSLVAACFFLRIGLLHTGISSFYFTPARFDTLSMGALLAVMEPEIRAERARSVRAFVCLAAFLGITLALGFLLFSGSHASWLQIAKYPATGIAYAGLIGVAVTASAASTFSRFFSWAALRWVGGISYGLYVYHPLCFFWANRAMPHSATLLRLGACFAFAALVAFLSFRYWETPFLRLKRFFQ
jgi:peptidoglycan/LPS O-acetylase OafA/YrhL